MFTRESFFASFSAAPPVEAVDVPGGRCFVRAMTVGEKGRFDRRHQEDPMQDFRERILIATVCDEGGRLLFSDADIPTLAQLPLPTIEPIVEAGMRVNGIGEKEAEELRKNSPGRNGSSSSGSPVTSDAPSANSNPG